LQTRELKPSSQNAMLCYKTGLNARVPVL